MRTLDFVRNAGEIARLLGAVALERFATGVVFNPMSRSHRRDPYQLYRRLRETDPIHRSRAAFGWVLTRYEDVLEVLRDPRFSADDRNFSQWKKIWAQRLRDGLVARDEQPSPPMLRLDPPDHTRLRSLVSKAFAARAVEKLRPRIEEIADQILDAFSGADSMELIRDFAVPLPITIIAEMLGIPPADREMFKRWSDDLVGFLDPTAGRSMAALRATVEEFREYVAHVAEERRRSPGDDLLSALVLAEDDGEKLGRQELYSTVALLLAAGNETTTNLIGNGLLALLRHPDQLALLRAAPSLLESTVEEILRYDSPVQVTARFPREDLEFRGHRFRRGQAVICLLGAANRDPARFADPDRLDITREDNRHLSFGHGVHFCLGAPLARIEAQVALGKLVARFPRMRLALEEPERGSSVLLRGPRTLPILLS